VLKKALDGRIAALGALIRLEIIADLDSLTETEHDDKRFLARSAPHPAASLALRAVGVALPAFQRPSGQLKPRPQTDWSAQNVVPSRPRGQNPYCHSAT
jgi:hypothetical protein